MKTRHNILIVDDDADDRDIVKDAFAATNNDQDYICLENGDKLLEYLEHTSGSLLPSLILLDLNMPGKDGRETLKEIKSNERFKVIPTVIFTTSSSHRDRSSSYDLGANCFVTKPDTFNKLIELAGCISRLWLS